MCWRLNVCLIALILSGAQPIGEAIGESIPNLIDLNRVGLTNSENMSLFHDLI